MAFIPDAPRTVRSPIVGLGEALLPSYQSRFLGRGCDEAHFSEKKGFSVERGEAIQ